jgi:pteridine reductase
MREGGRGVIINIVDVAGFRPWAGYLHYSVSKAGLIAMTRCLALELAPSIRVNAVAPGTVLPAEFQSSESLDAIRERTPLGRLGRPEDVGRAVVFLALGPDSITGQVLAVDGGRSLFSRD